MALSLGVTATDLYALGFWLLATGVSLLRQDWPMVALCVVVFGVLLGAVWRADE